MEFVIQSAAAARDAAKQLKRRVSVRLVGRVAACAAPFATGVTSQKR